MSSNRQKRWIVCEPHGSAAELAGQLRTSPLIAQMLLNRGLAGMQDCSDFLRPNLKLLHDPEFTDDPLAQASLWKTRKGIIPSIGAMRAPGTICINEDVAFPIHQYQGGIELIGLSSDRHYCYDI